MNVTDHDLIPLPHPHVGMRKIKSILSVFTGFCLWQIIRIFIPGLEVHPLFIYVYGLIEIRETSAKTRLNGTMRIKATFTAILTGLPLMAILDFIKKRVPLVDSTEILLELFFILFGALIVLIVAELVKCRMFCGLAAAIYIILMVSHMDDSVYLYSVMRASQTIMGVGVAWFINVKLLPYPPKPGTLSYLLLSKDARRKLNAKSVKVVFFDVDGTLISHNQNLVPESTRETIETLRKKDIKCVLATGRPMGEIKKLPVKDIRFDGYITLNGQLCYDDREKVILKTPMTGEAKERVLSLFQKKILPIALFEKDNIYINYIDASVIRAQQAINTELPPIGKYSGEDIYLAVAFLTDEKENDLKEYLSMCRIMRWSDYSVDIVAGEGDKAFGIKKYLEYENISVNDTMAFGDGDNDVGMLKYVRIGVAMGNSSKQPKINADYVTDSVDDDGIKKACIYYGLIEE